MKRYRIWMEGYDALGNRAGHEYIGSTEAESFSDACKIVVREWAGDKEYKKFYDEEYNTFWGCRLFDNEYEASRAFG